MELMMKECTECCVPKTASISLVASCRECGLDRREITYEIPPERMDEIIREFFKIIDSHKLHPKQGQDIPTYEELVQKLSA